MPYDAGVAAAVCFELNETLAGGRIEKIVQPTKEQIILQVYAKGARHSLCLDADPNSPKVYITDQTAENPPSVSAFYNILRKYLINAKIHSASLVGFDRIFEFRIVAADEMGFLRQLYLYAECIRKQSNIVLCEKLQTPDGVATAQSPALTDTPFKKGAGDKKIIGVIKPVDISMSESRQLLNGFLYIPPLSKDKTNPLEATPEEFSAAFGAALRDSPELPACEFLLLAYQGFSPLVTRELAFLASKGDASVFLKDIDCASLWLHFDGLAKKIKANAFAPVLLCDENGAPIDFSYTAIGQYGARAKTQGYDSMSKLVDHYYSTKEHDNRIRQKSGDILKVLANASSRLTKKLKLLEKELQDCQNRETLKIYGDLITANIYRLEKSPTYTLENFYDENKPIEISADKNLTPAQNAQRFYKKYNKLKTAEHHLKKQTEMAKDDMVYLDSVFESLTRALSERELSEIRDELSESGFIKPAKAGKTEKSEKSGQKQKKTLPVSRPAEFSSENGFKILCGRNNKQNDELTFKLAGKNDLWFHAQKIPGSHVVLMCGSAGKEPKNADIEYAAGLAAAYSKGKNMPLVPVDYTQARYVKKPNGAKPGFVIYTNFKTASVKPEKTGDN